jgi:hypothetical protein
MQTWNSIKKYINIHRLFEGKKALSRKRKLKDPLYKNNHKITYKMVTVKLREIQNVQPEVTDE